MTMVIGFLCPDGVVIGADRRISVTTDTGTTFGESKIESYRWSNGSSIVGYSGDRDTWIRLRKELSGRLGSSMVLYDDDLRHAIAGALDHSLADGEAFCTFVGYWVDGERPCLIKTDGKKISDVSSCEVIGWGNSSLSRYLMSTYEVLHHVSVPQVMVYAVNFISQATLYDGQYIGNGIDIYSLRIIKGLGPTPEGRVGVMMLPSYAVAEYQANIDAMNHQLNILFGHLTDASRPLKLDDFIGAIQKFRLWTSGSPEFTLSGFRTSGAQQ
jgi:hypothetical protein